MNQSDFDLWAEGLAYALSMSRKLQARIAPEEGIMHAIPSTTGGRAWRELIDRLNAIDPEGGWGRMKIGEVEFVAVKGTSEVPGGVWY